MVLGCENVKLIGSQLHGEVEVNIGSELGELWPHDFIWSSDNHLAHLHICQMYHSTQQRCE